MEIIQILIFAAIAVFLGVRLFSLLGKPTGRSHEEHAREMREKEAARYENKPQTTPTQTEPVDGLDQLPELDEATQESLHRLMEADPGFDPITFLKGARSAYEMIVTAYAKGDMETLKPLLSDRVASAYEKSITDRQSREEVQVTELERIKETRLREASLKDGVARIKVEFNAEIASEVRDKEGQVVSGDINTLKTVEEVWTFERRIQNDNPNWVLSGVRTL